VSASNADRALNRLAKWRQVLTGWQLGTRTTEDPECQAVRDHREATLLLRAEVSALVNLLVTNGVFTTEDWLEQLVVEADELSAALSAKFVGMRATDDGIEYDRRAAETMKGWRP